MDAAKGAHVTADVLCGASEDGFTTTQPQGADVTDKSMLEVSPMPFFLRYLIVLAVAAVVLMGDPSHVNGQPFNQGTSQKDGVRYNPKDPFWASGGERIC